MSPVWLKVFARLGYGARGVVYLIIGGLAFLAAIGLGGRTTDAKGALHELLSQPFGRALLVAMAVGLVGYASWRFIQSLLDADDHGTNVKGLVIRAGLFTSALTHLALAFYAFTLAFGQQSSGGGKDSLTAWLMGQAFGPYLVAAVGVAIIGAGLSQVWKGLSGGYSRHLSLEEHKLTFLLPICAFGLVSRGLVFCVIGGFFIYAAIHVDPEQAGGLDKALTWIRQQPVGTSVFVMIAVGLLAFGLYSLIEAIWRDIQHDGSRAASVLPEKPIF